MCSKCNLKKIDLISIMPQALKITRYEVNMQCNTSRCPNTAPAAGQVLAETQLQTTHQSLFTVSSHRAAPRPRLPGGQPAGGRQQGPVLHRGDNVEVSPLAPCLRMEARAQSAGLRRGRCCGARPPPAKVTPLSHPGPGPVSSAQLGDGALQVH